MRDIESLINEFSKRLEIILEYRGIKIMDSETAILLKLIEGQGSLLKASASIGIPYSKAWETIARIERALGIKIVERKRGGARHGGMKLTNSGKRLLEYYEELRRMHTGISRLSVPPDKMGALPDLVVMGSHDLLLERLLHRISSKYHVSIQRAWIGSCGGILAVIMGEADIAGIHLFNRETMEYNRGIIEKYGLEGTAVLIRGYDRELVLAYNPYYSYKDIDSVINDIIDGKLKIINRNRGSGTRILFDKILREKAMKRKQVLHYNKIRGYAIEVQTHQEVAEYIASGKADAGITLMHLAEVYGLRYMAIAREQYDFLVNISSNKYLVEKLGDILKEEIKDTAIGLKGYYIPQNIGEQIE